MLNEIIERAVFKVEQTLGRKLQPIERMLVEFGVITHKAVAESLNELTQELETEGGPENE